jgi:hypothetical protein
MLRSLISNSKSGEKWKGAFDLRGAFWILFLLLGQVIVME